MSEQRQKLPVSRRRWTPVNQRRLQSWLLAGPQGALPGES